MRSLLLLLLTVSCLASLQVARAESLWDRRGRNAYLFVDNRARRVGDLLTIVVHEATEFETNDKRELNKETKHGHSLSAKGDFAAGQNLQRSFAGDIEGSGSSLRKFDAKANSIIDRKFLDRMTVTVVGVYPNGNLVLEGHRTSVVNREMRALRVSGVVRPLDIGPFNTVNSQFIADLKMDYSGRGPESSYLNHGFIGRISNFLWPY